MRLLLRCSASGSASRAIRCLAASGLLAIPFTAQALDPHKSLFQYNLRGWTHEAGLPSDMVSAVTQSTDGYVWLATTNGLARFDGQEFTRFASFAPESERQVRSLAPAASGGIWLTDTHGVLGRYDGTKLALAKSPGRANTPAPTAPMVTDRDGNIWVGSSNGIAHYKVENLNAPDVQETGLGQVLALADDATGRLWIGTANHGLFSWSAGTLTKFPDAALEQRRILALAVDAQQHLWIGTDTGLRCYDQKGAAKPVPALNLEVDALLVDRVGDVWIGTVGAGVGRLQQGAFTFLGKADGLANDAVTSLYEDREGSVWVGTRGGLSQFTDVKFPIVTGKEGIIDGSAHWVAPSREGGIWIATNSGVSYYDRRGPRNYLEGILRPNVYIKLIFEARNGDVYFVDGDKVISVMSADRKIVARIPASDWPEAFTEDNESVVVNVGQTLCRIINYELQPYRYRSEPPRFDWIHNLSVTRDNAILVASAQGVFRIKDGQYERWGAAQGMSGDRAYFVTADHDGSIWVTLPTGLARIKGRQVRNITEENGLPDTKVFALIPDNVGFIWLCTFRGIVRVPRDDLIACAEGHLTTPRWEVFETMDAVKTTERTDQGYSAARTLDGRIWLPCPRGVIMIDPASYYRNTTPPLIHIEEVQLKLADGEDRGANRPVEFSFSALSYVAPKKVNAQYRLVGLDSSWLDADGRRSVRYNQLPPGKYDFEVRASNADGVQSSNRLVFELFPPFYQTAWFYTLCAAAGLIAIAGGYYWKMRRFHAAQQRLRRENEQLESRVAERTRELGEAHQQLLEISRQAGMAEVATSVLHNVGNVLNSANVSAGLLLDELRRSRITQVPRLALMLEEHASELAAFLAHDAKGQQVVPYLSALGTDLIASRDTMLAELENLRRNIDHIKSIVAMQQSFATVGGVRERFPLSEVVDDALQLRAAECAGYRVKIIRDYAATPVVNLERHKVLQIMVNLIQNAAQACRDANREDREIAVRIGLNDHALVSIVDNGVGIAPENLTRIFAHGFTTKKDGHGFGLHSCALAARELGGSLRAESVGPGQGAVFILELPVDAAGAAN